MKPFSLAVIAGTSEATDLIRMLPESWNITAFAATAYGKTILEGLPCTVQVGRLDAEGFRQALADADAVADASHPFAAEVTRTVRTVCRELKLPYFRLGRPPVQYAYDQILRVQSKEEAAAHLRKTAGNILLTTGGNTLAFYEQAVPDFAVRGYARILDTPDSRRMTAGSQAHLIFAVPPFSAQQTLELLQKYQIAVLVSKDSGMRGGVAEKVQAAKVMGIPVILIAPPAEATMTLPEMQKALLACAEKERKQI